jgi:hypothetical protein
MPRVGFEPTTPVLERVKMVHALDRAAGHRDRPVKNCYVIFQLRFFPFDLFYCQHPQ